LGAVAGLEKDFARRGAKVIGLSVDPVESHGKWAQDIQDVSGLRSTTQSSATRTQDSELYDMLAAVQAIAAKDVRQL